VSRWAFSLVVVVVGLLGLFILRESNAISYLSDKPEACVNCHIMNTAYNTWRHSSHGRDTVCNDCHVPQGSVAAKYFFKGMDGARHATMFTLRMEPKSFRISKAGAAVVQSNCERCHAHLVGDILENNQRFRASHPQAAGNGSAQASPSCWSCHQSVPHGRNFGLTGAQFMPKDAPRVSQWIKQNP
jgi:cytochrome c nitrite reductase small subunit